MRPAVAGNMRYRTYRKGTLRCHLPLDGWEVAKFVTIGQTSENVFIV